VFQRKNDWKKRLPNQKDNASLKRRLNKNVFQKKSTSLRKLRNSD
jgi:hypothetical protein